MYIWKQYIVCVYHIDIMHHQCVAMSVLWWELHSIPIIHVWWFKICACGQELMCASCNIMHAIKHGTNITWKSSGVACGHIKHCMLNGLCLHVHVLYTHTQTHTMLCVCVCVLWDRWWQTSPRSMRGVSLLAHVHSAHLIWFTNSRTWWHGVWAITNANAPRQCGNRDWSTMRNRHWHYKSKSASKSKASQMSTLCCMLMATIDTENLRNQIS